MFRAVITFALASTLGLGGVATRDMQANEQTASRLLTGAALLFTVAETLKSGDFTGETPTLQACVFTLEGPFGTENLADSTCLADQKIETPELNPISKEDHSLPAFCKKSIETRTGPREVFDLDCLGRWDHPLEART